MTPSLLSTVTDHLNLSRIASRNASEHLAGGNLEETRTNLLLAVDHALAALDQERPITIENLGSGITRVSRWDVGFADIEADYWLDRWTLSVIHTNISDAGALNDMLRAYRVLEGME